MAELSTAASVPRITRAARTVPAPAPAEEDGAVMSAAKTIGSGALSGLSMVGNLLDLPGSMVRDALVWDNPLDQFKDPLSHSDTGRSATGRDVLSRNFLTSWLISPNKETGMSGWADDPMEGVRDVAGFGVELATDPLSWFTGGLAKTPSAASKLRHLGSLGAAIETTAKAGKLGKLEKGLNIINELDPGTHVGRALGIPQWAAARKLAKVAAATRAAGAATDVVKAPFTAATGTVDDFVRDTMAGVIPKDGSPLSKEYEQFAFDNASEINDAFRRSVANDRYKTPEFKQWFGDWEADPVNASKVVDAEGAPLVVYHGTGTPDLGVKAAKESNAKTRKAAEEWAAHDELEKTNEPLWKVALKSTGLLKEKFGKDVTSVLTRSTKAPHIPWDVNAYDFSSPESLARSIYKTATNQEKELLWSRGVFREVDGKVSTNIDDSMLGTIRQSHSDWVNAESEFRRLSMKPKSQRPPKGWEDRLKSEDPSFDTTRSGANDHGYMSSGSYFTDSADEASGYATTTKTGTGGVIPVHLSLKNPFINGVSDSAPVESLASKILGKSITDATKRDPDEFSRAIALSRREALIELGYDGEIRRRSQAGDSKSFATDEYVAFYPEQIKSINNSGTYDPSDPNILASPSSAPASPRDFRSSQPATPDAPNQVTDSIPGATITKGRNAALVDATRKWQEGLITKAERDDIIDRYKPVLPYKSAPVPVTTAEVLEKNTDKIKEGWGAHEKVIKDGDEVGLRLDIPSYTNLKQWINSIHYKLAGKAKVAYGSVSRVTNAVFTIPLKKALAVATDTSSKSPFATIDGKWKGISAEEAHAKLKDIIDNPEANPEWRQVGMDPERHAYFYDRENHRIQYTSADEVIQVGPLVVAKNPVAAAADDTNVLFQFGKMPSSDTSPRDFRSSQPATPDAPNQVTDSILGEASIEAPLSGGVAGTLDKIGDTLTSLDPGTHVGRFIRRKLGDLNKAVAQYGQKKTLTQLVDENITQRIAQSKLGKAAAQFKTALSPREVQLPNTQAVIDANLTVQQELQSLIAGDSIARGSRVLTQLTEAQDLSKRVGAAFGADVLIWGGSKIPSKSGGVRRFAVGNRIWVNGDVQASELNSIVGHELLHLIRDVDNDAFHQIVDTINKHAEPGYLAKKTQEYMDGYKRVFGKDLHPGVAVEEGAARSVEAAFDRPAFWQELTADPKLEKKLRQVFTQAMDKLKGTLPAQEFEVLDKELSAFIFSKADQVRAGATDASIQTALGDRFLFNSNQPVADILATPGTKTHEVIDHAADLTSRINAGIKQAMNFKVGGHTYPVVQDFSKRRVDRLETLATDLSLPMLSAIETITKLASELPIDAQVARIAELDELVAQAIEKGDYSVLHRELHPAVRQMELVGRELLRLGITSGLKGKWLKDSYVNWFPHALHPKIQQKYNEAMAGKSSKSGADLGVSIKRTDAERTGLFREGFYGLTTWNEATTNPKAIDILSDEVRDFDERVKFAGNALRDEYIDDIDPRIPVMRDDKFQMIQKHPDGSLSPNPIPVSHSEMVRYARVDYTVAADGSRVPIDFNDVATRRDHHVNQPIEYTKTVKDADGNEIELQFELLTGRNDTRYGDTSPPANPQQVADWGYYKDPIEQRDRFHVLSEFMADVGTDTLSETGGVFGGSALHNYGHAINTRAGQVTTVSEMPELLLGGMQDGSIVPMTGDRAKVGKYLQLGKLFDSPYFSIVDRSVVYQKLATLEPSLANLMTQMSSKEFSNMMDGMMIKPEIFKDLTEVGVYMKGHPALDTFMKPLQSATAATKAGWLTHPATHNRNLISGLAQLVYGKLFSNSAAKTAYQVLYGQPSTELLHYGPIKKYLDRFELEHTPENATRAARVMFANYMKESGNIYSSQYADPTDFKADASNAASSILESMPGDGRSGFWDMMKGAAKTSIGREGDTSWNPFDISGVQRFFDKKDTAGKVIEKAGDVRAKTKFAPVAGSNIIGKHVNDVTRMAGWLEGMRRGNSADGAWKAVDFNQINYNPRTFGPVESKILKKVFPFYSFMSRETAWVAHELMTNPSGRLGKMIRLGRHANSTNQNEYLPEHISEGLSVPISGHRTDGVQQYLTGLGFMFEDSIKMAGNVMSGTKDISRDLLSKSNPLIKAPAEWGLGRSSFQGGPMGGRDIEDMDPVLGRIFTQLGLQAKKEGGQAAPAFGSRGLEFVLSNSPVSRILSSSKTLLDDRKSLLSRASNVLTGIKITSVSPEQRQRGLREILNARAKELGARPFTTLHISKSMLEAAKANEANDPELYQEMLLISNKRKQLDKSQRIKRKAAATP